MRKIMSICILACLLFISGCLNQSDETIDYEVDVQLNMVLNNEDKAINFMMMLESNIDLDHITDVRVELRYKINATTEDLDTFLNLGGIPLVTASELTDNALLFTLDADTLDYENDYVSAFLNIYFSDENNQYHYTIDEIITTNLYTLAKASSGVFADEIIDAVENNEAPLVVEVFHDVSLNNEAFGIDFISTIESSDDVSSLHITELGYIYVANDDTDFTLDTSGVHLITLDAQIDLNVSGTFQHTLSDITFDYSLDRLYVRSYITVTHNDQTQTYYSQISHFTLYELALDKAGAFADEIIDAVESNIPDETVIHTLDIVVDLTNYTVVDQPSNMVVNVSTDYKKVTVEMILDSTFTFSSQLIFTFNQQVINDLNFDIEGQTITYQFDDPNWSGIY